jgi:hypothetical protein
MAPILTKWYTYLAIIPQVMEIYLKSNTPGKFAVNGDVLPNAEEAMGICGKSFKKYIKVLFENNWLKYSHKHTYIFVTGFDKIRQNLGLTDRKAILYKNKDFRNFNEFLTGSVITGNISRQKRTSINKEKHTNSAFKISDNAQLLDYINYFGISNKGIGRLLGCKQTRACVLKNKAEKAKYITTKEKFHTIASVPSGKGALEIAKLKYPSFSNKMKIAKSSRRTTSFKCLKHVDIQIQLHDEIKSNMTITRRKGI